MKLTKKQIATLNDHPHLPKGKNPSECPRCYKRRILVVHKRRRGSPLRRRRPRPVCRECFANMYRDIPCDPPVNQQKKTVVAVPLIASGAVVGLTSPILIQRKEKS